MTLLNRRQMIRGSGAIAACAVLTSGRRASAEPRAQVKETTVISFQKEYYHGWPTLARRRNGQLLLAYSGGRELHICPFGRVELMRSDDDGRSWTWPQVVLDTVLDDRDSGVLETAKGSILVVSFNSLDYEIVLARVEKMRPGWPPERLKRWQAARNCLTPAQRQAKLGSWMLRSTDGGASWSACYRTPVGSPHGPVQLTDGRVLYAGKERAWTNEGGRNGVCQSTDDGQTWTWLAEIPTRPGDNRSSYFELHAVEATDGRLVVQIRNQNKANDGETLQCESSDGGKTWSMPHSIGVWGHPSYLLRLKDGRLLMTYGFRAPPFGNQARLSENGGRIWSKPMTISSDGCLVSDPVVWDWPNARVADFGYPSTVELGDGSLLTVWYEQLATSPRAVLRQARWTCG